MAGDDVWAYDKRFHTALEESLRVPPITTPPPFQARAAAEWRAAGAGPGSCWAS